MAKLQIQTQGLKDTLIELRLGVNRVGRSPDADIPIKHITISGMHCELILRDSGVSVRDLGSTNGTFINNEPVTEAELSAGQTLRLGDVEILVENTDVVVAIPVFNRIELPAPPVVQTDGGIVCPRHRLSQVTYQCTVCKEVMCDSCVHQLRRKGSKNVLMLCPICSSPVEPLGGVRRRGKKSIFTRVAETVKMKFKSTVNLDNRP